MKDTARGATKLVGGRPAAFPCQQLEHGRKLRVHSLSIDDPPLSLSTNWILAALPPAEPKFLPREMDRVTFHANDIIFSPGEPARYVYFPEQAVVSLLATMEDGRTVEVGLTGAEGVLGIHEVLGASSYGLTALVQIAGSCLRMEMKPFKDEFERRGTVHARSLHYLRYLLLQASQISACNRLHRVRQRLARHLLMIQDRVGRNEFSMRHETLSYVLGTPRSEVSFAAEALRHFGMIDYSRGKMSVLERPQLKTASCECYGVIHRELLNLMTSLNASKSTVAARE